MICALFSRQIDQRLTGRPVSLSLFRVRALRWQTCTEGIAPAAAIGRQRRTPTRSACRVWTLARMRSFRGGGFPRAENWRPRCGGAVNRQGAPPPAGDAHHQTTPQGTGTDATRLRVVTCRTNLNVHAVRRYLIDRRGALSFHHWTLVPSHLHPTQKHTTPTSTSPPPLCSRLPVGRELAASGRAPGGRVPRANRRERKVPL